jgi:hypothetical protein
VNLSDPVKRSVPCDEASIYTAIGTCSSDRASRGSWSPTNLFI